MSTSTQVKLSASKEQTVSLEKSSLGAQNIRMFMRNPGAVGGALFLLVVMLLVILAPWVTPFEPKEIDVQAIRKPPNDTHYWGRI